MSRWRPRVESRVSTESPPQQRRQRRGGAQPRKLAHRNRILCESIDDGFFARGKRRLPQHIGLAGELVHHARLDPRDGRNHAAIDLGERHHVVGREELHHLEMRAIEQRLRFEQLDDGLQMAIGAGEAGRGFQHHAGNFSRLKRDQHTMARAHAAFQFGRDRIGQFIDPLTAPTTTIRTCIDWSGAAAASREMQSTSRRKSIGQSSSTRLSTETKRAS